MATWLRGRYWMRRYHCWFTAREEGMGLVEVLIAIVLLMVVLVPSAMLLTNTVDLTAQLGMRTTASQLASAQIACVDAQPVAEIESKASGCASSSQMVPSTVSYQRTVGVAGSGQITYTVTQATSWQQTTQAGGGTTYTCLALKVSVKWPNRGSTESLSRSSMGSCEPTPQLKWSPGSLAFPGWDSETRVYMDASPGNHSLPQTVTLTVQPPQTQSESYDYVAIGNLSVAGSDSQDFTVEADTCSGTTIYSPTTPTISPASCSFSVVFDPPSDATAGDVSAVIDIPDNAQGAPQTIPVSGYVSPDLFVVAS